jgi:hypothetical protein
MKKERGKRKIEREKYDSEFSISHGDFSLFSLLLLLFCVTVFEATPKLLCIAMFSLVSFAFLFDS